jgi:hypothetical protein
MDQLFNLQLIFFYVRNMLNIPAHSFFYVKTLLIQSKKKKEEVMTS